MVSAGILHAGVDKLGSVIIRLRLPTGSRVKKSEAKNHHVALGAAALLAPAVLTSYVLGTWALAADLRMAGAFGIRRGFFSHWQVWMGLAGVLHVAAVTLNRYGHGQGFSVPFYRGQTRD